MDAKALHDCFAATLTADQNTRRQAEVQLRAVENNIGFLGACLDILSSADVNPGVKTAAAVFFKNRIVRNWNEQFAESDENNIDNDEKPIIRERLLKTLVQSPAKLRKQLIPVLSTIVKTDYPKQWPNLLYSSLELLYSQNLDSAYTGLLCFAEVCSSFRWVQNNERPELDSLINTHFSTLLQVADTLLKEESQEAGEMVVLLLKIYKYSTYHDLPEPLQTPENVANWTNFHVAVINKPVPPNVLNLDEQDRRFHPWSKTKKWAYANLYRLFTRYASNSLSKRFEYTQFKENFVQNYVPQLLTLFLGQIDRWCSKQLWIADEALYHMISFLENAITQKQTWPMIKPHYELLVSHFIFPLLCPSDSTLENFEDDPEDYIHTKLDIYDDNNSPDLAAISLLITLTTKKKKTTLESILQFSFNLLSQYKSTSDVSSKEDAKKLEGGLRLIGSLSDHFTNEKSPYYPQMEEFLSNLIIPHLNSQHSFIKARACEVVARFSDIQFRNETNLANLYRGILSSFNDENLPVQLEAALALQAFVKIPQFKEALGSVIVPTMEKLLVLSNQIDAEVISGVMQELVEVFSEQLQPFGVNLMNNLVEQFLRLARELEEAANANADDLDGNYDDLTDKQMAALGLLNTMITVLLSFESSREVVFQLETTFYPAVEFVYVNKVEDFYREAGELFENSTFLTREVSPAAWNAFGLIMQSLTDSTAILYLEEIMPALNNYLVYGAETFKNNEGYTRALLQLFEYIMKNEDSEVLELAIAGEIAQKLVLALGNLAKPYLQGILSVTINAVINVEEMTTAFAVNMIGVVVSGLIHFPHETLSTLVEGNFIIPFFNLWFQQIAKFNRVYDMKLSTLGLLSLISLPSSEFVNLHIDSIAPQFGSNLALLMYKLPTAIQDLDKRRKEYDGEEMQAYDGSTYDDEDWNDEDVDEDANAQADDDYLQFLAEEAKKLQSSNGYEDGDWDEDDELVEDALANNILDGVNVFATFKDSILVIQNSDPAKYQQIFGSLKSDEQQTLQSVIELQ